MNNKTISIEGKDFEKLVLEAEKIFNTSRDNIKIEILQEEKRLFSKYYKIKATLIHDFQMDKMKKIVSNIESDLKTKEKDYTDNEIISNYNEPEITDSRYEVTTNNDGMEAYITVYPPVGGKEIDKEDILFALEEKKIKSGILYDEIDRMVKEKRYNTTVLIAKGIPAIHGEDGKIEYHFDVIKDKKMHVTDDGRVDYKELSLINNVNEGQLLATLTPPTKGKNGIDVYGNTIKAKDGKPVNTSKGKNVAISEDGLKLISQIDGEVKIVDNKINVLPIHTVEGNVDNSTGNIRFIGKVVVKGNVLTGFTIDAEEDVEVFGVVEGALIKSRGNIILHRGIQGMNKGELLCEGDLIAKFIENSKVYAKGNIQTEAIMHSTVYCGKKLEVLGKKGLIVGGDVKASDEIKAKIIGSPMATITKIEVGTNPDIRKKYDDYKKERQRYSDNLKKLTQAVDLLTRLNKKCELSEEKRQLLNKSIKVKLQTQKALENLQKDITEIEKYIEDISNGKIKVENIVYPGTNVTIGSNCIFIRDQIHHATFYRAFGEIKIGSYEP